MGVTVYVGNSTMTKIVDSRTSELEMIETENRGREDLGLYGNWGRGSVRGLSYIQRILWIHFVRILGSQHFNHLSYIKKSKI